MGNFRFGVIKTFALTLEMVRYTESWRAGQKTFINKVRVTWRLKVSKRAAEEKGNNQHCRA